MSFLCFWRKPSNTFLVSSVISASSNLTFLLGYTSPGDIRKSDSKYFHCEIRLHDLFYVVFVVVHVSVSLGISTRFSEISPDLVRLDVTSATSVCNFSNFSLVYSFLEPSALFLPFLRYLLSQYNSFPPLLHGRTPLSLLLPDVAFLRGPGW